MAAPFKITPATVQVLQTFVDAADEAIYGLQICKSAGLKSGTLYPILERLESSGWIEGQWKAPDPDRAGPSAAAALQADRAGSGQRGGRDRPAAPGRPAPSPPRPGDCDGSRPVTAVLVVLATLSVAVGGLIQAEIKGRVDWLPERLIRLAVERLPPGVRSTREEEWLAELEDRRQMPLSRLGWALWMVIGAGPHDRALDPDHGARVQADLLRDAPGDLAEGHGGHRRRSQRHRFYVGRRRRPPVRARGAVRQRLTLVGPRAKRGRRALDDRATAEPTKGQRNPRRVG